MLEEHGVAKLVSNGAYGVSHADLQPLFNGKMGEGNEIPLTLQSGVAVAGVIPGAKSHPRVHTAVAELKINILHTAGRES